MTDMNIMHINHRISTRRKENKVMKWIIEKRKEYFRKKISKRNRMVNW